MKIFVQGQGEVTLTQREFIASGGEGSIYGKGSTAYKLYTDPARMLPLGKITELASITHPNVIKPEHVILDTAQRPAGYTMRFVQDTIPLCQIFTRAFREREGVDHTQMLGLVKSLQHLIREIHKANVLVVDLNEMNFLVDKSFSEIFAIDVDSYQTAHYPATAIMPSVRDWSVKGHAFTEGSDWFSFACVAFTMLVGIHPFKGKHPSVHGLEDRMKANLSVFEPGVTLPKVVYPLSIIPQGYRAWFEAIFQKGVRVAPPKDPGEAYVLNLPTRVFEDGDQLVTTLLSAFAGVLQGIQEHAGSTLAWTSEGVYLNDRRVRDPAVLSAVAFSPKQNKAVCALIDGGRLNLFDTDAKKWIPFALEATQAVRGENVFLAKCGDKIVEVTLQDLGSTLVAGQRVAANVLEHATILYEKVAVQDLLGASFVSLFPQAGQTYTLRIPELDGHRVVDAKYDRRVLMIVYAEAGMYHRQVFVFNEDHSRYTALDLVKDITLTGLNFISLDNGVFVHLNEEEQLEVRSVSSPQKVRVVKAEVLGNDMRLVKYKGRAAFIRGNNLYSLGLK